VENVSRKESWFEKTCLFRLTMNSKTFLQENTLVPLAGQGSATLGELNDTQIFMCQEVGRGKRVVDLGCGDGRMLERLNEQCNEAFGVEYNRRLVSQAQQRGLRVRNFDLNEGIPFEDEYFDCVVASDVVDSIFDSRFMFEEVHRILRRRGIFLFSVPNLNSLSNRIQMIRGSYLKRAGGFPEDTDGMRVRFFNTQKIYELCRFSGFHVHQIWGLPSAESSDAQGNRDVLRSIARPLYRWRPEVADILVVRARRIDV